MPDQTQQTQVNPETQQDIENQRWELLQQLEDWLELPVMLLGFAWLILLIIDLVSGLTPFLDAVFTAIWIVFVVDFLLRFILAPRKINYLKHNWLTVISLLLPAVRVLRIAMLARFYYASTAVRGTRMVRIISSLNRGIRTLRHSLGKRGVGFVLAMTVLVTLVGAAGMFGFEYNHGLNSYADALWWTSMIMTTLGSSFSPHTGAGRLLGFLLSVYAITVFGYITAAIASYLIGEDTENPTTEAIDELKAKVDTLTAEIQRLSQNNPNVDRQNTP